MAESPVHPVGINYQRGRFAVRDYPPLSSVGAASSPVAHDQDRKDNNEAIQPAVSAQERTSFSENAASATTAFQPTEATTIHGPRMTVFTQPPQFVFRPVYMPATSPVVVATPYDAGPGSKEPSTRTSHLTFAGVLQGLDKIRAAHVQHQKTLRDLIIFHRPAESVIDSDQVPSVVDRIHELAKALEVENQQLAEQNRLLRLQCKERNIVVPDMGYNNETTPDEYI